MKEPERHITAEMEKVVDIPCRAKGNLVAWLEGHEVPPDLQPLPSLKRTVLKPATLSPLNRESAWL